VNQPGRPAAAIDGAPCRVPMPAHRQMRASRVPDLQTAAQSSPFYRLSRLSRRLPRTRRTKAGIPVSHDRGAVTVGNEAPVWPSSAPRTATTTSSVTSRSDRPARSCSLAAGDTFLTGRSPASSAQLKVLHHELTASAPDSSGTSSGSPRALRCFPGSFGGLVSQEIRHHRGWARAG
jgi:hypothetical protein